jgi:hypothetical protein
MSLRTAKLCFEILAKSGTATAFFGSGQSATLSSKRPFCPKGAQVAACTLSFGWLEEAR